ncbi:MAG: ABC transporter permease subunit [bacterium]
MAPSQPGRILRRHSPESGIEYQRISPSLFSWPGMGQLMVESAAAHDYPVAQGTFLMLAILVIGLNFLTDILYCYLDPRIKVSNTGLT